MDSKNGNIDLDKARDLIVSELAKPLGEFAAIEKEKFNEAVLFAALALSESGMPENELAKVLEWAHKIQLQACALHFVLIGVAQVRVINGEVNLRMPGGDSNEAIRQLARNAPLRDGLAKKRKVETEPLPSGLAAASDATATKVRKKRWKKGTRRG